MATIHHLSVSRDDSAYELGRWAASITSGFGADVIRQLTAFASVAESGSSIAVRRDREGFTSQTTRRAVKGVPRSLTTDGLNQLALELGQCPQR
jgi:hypothetical protein